MIPSSIRVPVPGEYAFPKGALALGVEPLTDFDKRGQRDDQARDENGVRLWVVRGMDLDEDAGKFGRSTEFKVKIAAEQQPVLPTSPVPGYPPVVEFTDLVVTPYADTNSCKGSRQPNQPHKCRARLAWSFRASAVIAPAGLKSQAKAA